MKSPTKVALMVGMLIVLLMPPLVPKHLGYVTNWINPPNRSWFFYKMSPEDKTLKDIPFLRTSKSSIRLEDDVSNSDKLPGYTYEQYLERFTPLPPPSRHWVHFFDFDKNQAADVCYLSTEEDSTYLYVFDAISWVQRRKVLISQGGGIYYSSTRIFDKSDASSLYLSLVKKLDKGKFKTEFFSYNYEIDSLQLIHEIDGRTFSYHIKNFEDYVLFSKKEKSFHEFHIYDIKSDVVDSFQVDTSLIYNIYASTINTQVDPYAISSEALFVRGKNNCNLCSLNSDSLFVSRKIIKNEISKAPKGGKVVLKHILDDVLFYTVEKEDKSSQLFKYELANEKSTLIKYTKNRRIGNVLYYGDIDGEGNNEIVFLDITMGKEAICIKDETSQSKLIRIPFQRERLPLHNCSLEEPGRLNIEGKGICWVLHFKQNPKYNLRWLIFAGILSFSWFIGFVIEQVRENRELRRKETNNKILQLQLENVQKRIDPHFIFNSLNNLGSLILEGESNESYDYLSKVSGVLYKALRNRNILVTVEEELHFCTSVLDTQRQRFKGKFDYEVFVDKGVDVQSYMPSNILNSMVDNCIKHGFSGIDYLGIITIEVTKKEEGFLLIVEDNGKGRQAASADKDQTKSTGTGLEICDQYVTLLNNERKSNLLYFSITDLYYEDKSKGTRCMFYVPDDLKHDV